MNNIIAHAIHVISIITDTEAGEIVDSLTGLCRDEEKASNIKDKL
jgi:hypothetical protein